MKRLTTLFPILAWLCSLSAWADGWQPLPGDTVPEAVVAQMDDEALFRVEPLGEDILARMRGLSMPDGCTVSADQLRYLHALHRTADGTILAGEMVVSSAIADDVREILLELFRARYPIERMRLIDDYGADDEASMNANNTSAFCYRRVAGTRTLSRHALGMAVDINPLYNPCCRQCPDGTVAVQPEAGRPYADRTVVTPYRLVRGDLCHRLFLQHGFRWGGAWRTTKDYQHFEK